MREKLTVSPLYAPGEMVRYHDRQNRVQVGAVRSIEARWYRGFDPLIIYQVSHPTYRGRVFYATEAAIAGRAALNEVRDG